MFHRPLKACLITKDSTLNEHVAKYGIQPVKSMKEGEEFDIIFTVDEPLESSSESKQLKFVCFPAPR